jgi:hypothetical protein
MLVTNKGWMITGLALGTALSLTTARAPQDTADLGVGALSMSQALAATMLNPADINIGTEAGRANFVRFMYFLVNGAATGYEIPGPPGGYVGIINEMTGANGLGGGLKKAGYNECSDIPTSGTVSHTGSNGTFAMTFATGSKTVPSHFGSNAGETFGKKVTVTRPQLAAQRQA